MKRLGYIPNAYDRNDFKYLYNKDNRSKISKYATGKKPIDVIPYILDQKATNSCVANAVIMIIVIALIQANKYKEALSVLYNYYYGRYLMGIEDEDRGMSIRSSFNAINQYGIAKDKKWKLVESKINKKPSFISSVSGWSLKDLINFYWLSIDGQNREANIKHAIDNGRAVVFGTGISNEFFDWKLSKGSLEPPSYADIIGGHALYIADYFETKTKTDYIITNSWGGDYGNNGYLIMSSDYINWDQTRDMAVVLLKGEQR